MKKIYEKPLAISVKIEIAQMVCFSEEKTTRTYNVDDGFEWGATTGTSQYANDDWLTEGRGTGTTGGWSTSPDTGDPDVDSRAKGFTW